ncbi:MAG: hypothetical protein IKJ01_02360 [Lachnospiraceae bacterium]|nr:hypothetical protein [Lachnospiraceae bacterium]
MKQAMEQKADKIHQAIDFLDDDLLEETNALRQGKENAKDIFVESKTDYQKKKRFTWNVRIIGTFVACFCVFVISMFVEKYMDSFSDSNYNIELNGEGSGDSRPDENMTNAKNPENSQNSNTNGVTNAGGALENESDYESNEENNINESTNISQENQSDRAESDMLDNASSVNDLQTESRPQSESANTIESTVEGADNSTKGIYLPQMEVYLKEEKGVQQDMLAFFIYEGRSYIAYEWIENGEDLVGEYIGTSTGLIDEWTTQDGYVDFAGSIGGDFYSVKGFDTSFMLCMKMENGTIETFINDNGIRLQQGSDLLEERLHLSENYTKVAYLSQDDWNYSKRKPITISSKYNEVIERFIEVFNKAEFMMTEDIPSEDRSDVFLNKQRYHLYFTMKNGMTFHFRFFEGGYVCFNGVIDACVQIEEAVFNELVAIFE